MDRQARVRERDLGLERERRAGHEVDGADRLADAVDDPGAVGRAAARRRRTSATAAGSPFGDSSGIMVDRPT